MAKVIIKFKNKDITRVKEYIIDICSRFLPPKPLPPLDTNENILTALSSIISEQLQANITHFEYHKNTHTAIQNVVVDPFDIGVES